MGNGLPKLIREGNDYPFLVVSPQCPEHESWTSLLDVLKALVEEIITTYTVDTARIYLTGLSMGGYGAWALAIANPDLFAAVVPICGGGDLDKVCAISHVPVWAFHGALDTVVPPERTKAMVDALKCCDGNVQFTIYPDAGHDAWTETYNNPALYSWLLQHIRTQQA
jgi:predicted peptidase